MDRAAAAEAHMGAPPHLKRQTGRYRLWGVLVVVAIAAGGVFWWASSDGVVVLEDDIASAFDSAFGDRPNVSWCQGTCSASGHEWHSTGSLPDVAELVAERARAEGAAATVEVGDPGAMLVHVERGSHAMSVGITDPTWVNAAPDAAGVSVWFTSVTAFDVGESG